jgi:hypothetical protein
VPQADGVRHDLGFDECQQIRVDFVLVGRAHAVRRALINLQLGALDDFGGKERRCLDRNDLIIVTVQDERRNVELLEVFGEVGYLPLSHRSAAAPLHWKSRRTV